MTFVLEGLRFFDIWHLRMVYLHLHQNCAIYRCHLLQLNTVCAVTLVVAELSSLRVWESQQTISSILAG